jgi:hypothetical protein
MAKTGEVKLLLRGKHLSRRLMWPFFLSAALASAQVASQNINMVSGINWPKGDPFLQRQNEPSVAVSSRNPAHLFAGANDYRTVDLPRSDNGQLVKETGGDAWLGVFKSFDNGDTWQSDLIPGYPQDTSLIGMSSPIYGLQAGADPVVRPGTNGMFYYAGMAFSRTPNSPNKIFVARFVDDNNLEAGDPIRYIDTQIVGASNNNDFFDKPSLAVDLPRPGVGSCSIPKPVIPPSGGSLGGVKFDDDPRAHFAAGRVYVAYTRFVGGESNQAHDSRIVFSHSNDCANTFSPGLEISTPGVNSQGAVIAIDPNNGFIYVFWRQFGASAGNSGQEAIMTVVSMDGGASFSAPSLVANIKPFEEGTDTTIFRTNAYPTAIVDGNSRIYVAWSERSGPSGAGRIMLTQTLPVYMSWQTPTPADPNTTPPNPSNPGHQLMPALSLSGNKVTLAYYDLRQDHEIEIFSLVTNSGGVFNAQLQPAPVNDSFFTAAIDDKGLNRRHTMDIRVSQASVGSALQNSVSFPPSILVSKYAFGSLPPKMPNGDPDNTIQQIEFNPPDLPMFKNGTVPFMGDYIDVASPIFVANPDGTWSYNTTDSSVTHVVWTDNRDVVAPGDGDWTNYTPLPLPGNMFNGSSTFDPTKPHPACSPNANAASTGSRNQNIYTSRITPGVSVEIPGAFKPFGNFQRAFPVTVQNTTGTLRSFLLKITQQPPGGAASFIQMTPVPVIVLQINVAPYSSSTRTVFATSTNPVATIPVLVQETTANAVLGTTTVTLNSDPTNPTIINPNIPNPNIPNPNIPNLSITNAEIYNPNIPNATLTTPDVSNPNIPNPNIPNPNIPNPNIPNYVIANPNIPNPNIPNPNIPNPNIPNPNIPNPNIPNPNIPNISPTSATLSDTTWSVTNNGNTTSGFTLKLLPTANSLGPGSVIQMVISKPYLVPAPELSNQMMDCKISQRLVYEPLLNIPEIRNLQGLILDPNNPQFNPDLLNPDAPTVALGPGESAYVTIRILNPSPNSPINATTLYTPVGISHGFDTGSSTYSVSLLRVVTSALPNGQINSPYSAAVLASGGIGPYQFSASGLPAGLFINSSNGVVSGAPTASGSFVFVVTVADSKTPQSTFTQPVNLTILGPGVIVASNPPLANAQQGVPYSATLTATGGAPGYTWAPISGNVPPGLSLSGAGTISGTPTAAGTFSFTVQAKDTVGATGALALSLTVLPSPLQITTQSPLPAARLGSGYSQTMMAIGGSGQYTWSAPGNMPAGLSLNSSGLLTGTPTSAGDFTINVQVNDGTNTASKVLSLTISSIVTITTNSLPIGFQGLPYTVTPLQGTGGNTWTATPLPHGLTLTPQGVIYGIPDTVGTTKVTITLTDGYSTATTELPITIQGVTTSTSVPVSMTLQGIPEIVATPGQTLWLTVDWTLQSSTVGCPSCPYQIPVGFMGQSPQSCIFDGSGSTGQNGVNFKLTAPGAAGRYYVVFGFTQGSSCQPKNGYGFFGGPEQAIALIDVIPSTVAYKNATVSNLSVANNGTNYAFVPLGANVPLSFSYTLSGMGPQALQFGLTGQLPDSCGTADLMASVMPLHPGRYYIGFDLIQGGCTTNGWATSPPDASRAIGVVDVAVSF